MNFFKLILTMCSLLSLLGCVQPSRFGGVVDSNALQPCNNTQNCVSTDDYRSSFQVKELTFNVSRDNVIDFIHAYIKNDKTLKLIKYDNELKYFLCTATTKIGFIDDVEFLVLSNSVKFRSHSRLGYSDLGLNRKRYQLFFDNFMHKFNN